MKRNRAAFTIIECALAIAISASLLLAAIALLPAGLDATRVAAHSSAEASILQRIRRQCAQSVSLATSDLYFDEQGATLPSLTSNAVFAVRVEALAAIKLPGDTTSSMRRIRITLSDHALNAPFADSRRLRVHHLLLAPTPQGGAS